ncbi:unnamed protein product, partial [marine sediment metagenome]
KRLLMRSKWVIISYNIFDNWRAKILFKSGHFKTSYGSVINKISLQDSLNYINNIFNDYITYSSLSINKFKGKRILEIGPGDNLGVALRFLAAEASQVVCLDKFYVKRKFEKEYRLYRILRGELDDNLKIHFDEVIVLKNGIKINPDKLKYICGIGIDEARNILEQNSFDFIISRAVLEHIDNLDDAFSVMDNLLIPGGYMLHKIDFKDHGIFSNAGKHPLTFLTVPNFIYRLMTKHSGKPNRRLIQYYYQKMMKLRYDYKIFITGIVGEEKE